ncbi:hypothetical protein EV715DRAFT_264329 [Schizophyllum commune]
MGLRGKAVSAFAVASESKASPPLRVQPQYSTTLVDSALAGILAIISSHHYPHHDIDDLLASNLDTDAPGFLRGYLADFDIAKLHSKSLLQVLISSRLRATYPDLCYLNPVIVGAVLRAMACETTLAALARSLGLCRGGTSEQLAAGLMEGIFAALDAKEDGFRKAQEFAIRIMDPLIGQAVRVALRHDERSKQPEVPKTIPVFTLRRIRVSDQPTPSFSVRVRQSNHESDATGPSSRVDGGEEVSQLCMPHAVGGDDAGARIGTKRRRDSDMEDKAPDDSAANRIDANDKKDQGSNSREVDRVDSSDGEAVDPHDDGVQESEDPPRKKQRPASCAKRVETLKHRLGKGGRGRKNNKASLAGNPGPLPKLSIATPVSRAYCYPLQQDTIALLSQPDLASYGQVFDLRVGGNFLHYILIAAMREFVGKPGTLTSAACLAALNALSSQDLLAKLARDLGLASAGDEKAHRALLSAIGRMVHDRPIAEARAHILAIFSPLVLVALNAVKSIEAPVQSAAEIDARRELVRRAFRLKEGEYAATGSTPMATFLSSAPDKTVEALLKRELLEDLEII